MKRPSFQFYPGDWRKNAKLRRCTDAARGAWMDLLCVLHDADEYGVCRWPLVDLARSAGVPLRLAKELSEKGVLKGADRGAAPYIFTPTHAGKNGEPATLVEPGDGPCWYCSRFVRDEWIRQRRGQSTQFSADNQPPKATPDGSPKATPNPTIGERQGDGPSSSSSASLRAIPSEAIASAAEGGGKPERPEALTPDEIIFGYGVPMLTVAGSDDKHARSFLAGLRKGHGDKALVDALRECIRVKPLQPLEWLAKALPPKGEKNGKHAGFAEKNYREGVSADGSFV